MLGDLKDETATLGLLLALGELNVESVKNGREVIGVELDVDDGTNDGLDVTSLGSGGGRVGAGGLDCRRWLVTRFFLSGISVTPNCPGVGFFRASTWLEKPAAQRPRSRFQHLRTRCALPGLVEKSVEEEKK